MKNFYTAQDIEDLAAQGKRELVIDDDAVLTDLARHMADQLGVSITNRSRSASSTSTPRPVPSPSAVPVSGSAPRASIPVGSKPKGCQHGPLPPRQSPGATSVSNHPDPASPNSNTMVDQLVGLVKRLGGKDAAS